MTAYFEKHYCPECCCQHWLEITRSGRIVCHGTEFFPRNDPAHYTRRSGRGFKVIEKLVFSLPLDWQMAAELHSV